MGIKQYILDTIKVLILFILFTAFTLAAPVANAAEMCSSIFSKAKEFEVIRVDNRVAHHDVVAFSRVITEINQNLGSLKIPQNVTVKVFMEHVNPVAIYLQKEIKIGVRYKRAGKIDSKGETLTGQEHYFKAPSFSRAILAHEHGHLIFAENFRRIDKSYDLALTSFSKMVENLKELEILSKETMQLKLKLIMSETDGPARAEMEQTLAQKESAKELLERENAHARLAAKIIDKDTPYNELFADVVAVVTIGKPDSISSALRFTSEFQSAKSSRKARQDAEQRGFESHFTENNTFSDHNYFSLVREQLWTSYLSSPTIRNQKRGLVLEAVFAAVAKNITHNIKNEHEPTNLSAKNEADWRYFNEKLMIDIDHEMAIRGIQKLK